MRLSKPYDQLARGDVILFDHLGGREFTVMDHWEGRIILQSYPDIFHWEPEKAPRNFKVIRKAFLTRPKTLV